MLRTRVPEVTTGADDLRRPFGAGRLRSALGIAAGEAPLAGWMATLFAVTQAGHGLGANTADALFFLRFGVEYLPVMILLSGLAVMGATLCYMAGLARVGPGRWLAWTLWALAGWLVLERIAVALDAPGVYPVVWLGAQVGILLSLTVLWNAAAEVSTTRQAKRLYPLFASAGIAGGIVGNAATGPLAVLVGVENLLLVHAGLFGAAAFVMTLAVRRLFQASGAPRATRAPVLDDLRGGLQLTRTTPLLRLAAGVAFALSALFFMVTFPFSEVVAGTFDSEAEVAGFLGGFSAIATAVTFLVSLLVTNRLLSRLGVVATLLVVPLVYAAGFGLWLVGFGLATATLVRGAQWVAVNAIATTAQSSLFNVLPGRRRSQVLAFVAGVPTQLGTVASGALLLVGLELGIGPRSAIGLGVAAITIVLVLRMRPAYAAALLDAVRGGLTDVFSTPVTSPAAQRDLDADAMRACSTGLQDRRPAARAAAVTTLSRLGSDEAIRLLGDALDDEEPRVRLAALDAVASHASAVGYARRLLADPSPQVRRRAVAVLEQRGAALGPQSAGVLADPDPVVRATAAAIADPSEGRGVLARMLMSSDPLERAAALEVVTRRPAVTDVDPGPFVEDPDPRVRATAAAALTGRPAAGPLLRRLLDDRSVRVRTAAATALVGEDATRDVLFDVLRTGSVRASDAAVRALAEAGLGGARFGGWIAGEVDRARFLRRHATVLRGAPAGGARDLLARLLLERHERLVRWTLLAMSTPETEAALALVRRGLHSTDRDVRGQALEALETVADRSLTRGLVALLEDDVSGDERDVRPSLRALARDHDEWIRTLAVRSLMEDLRTDLDELRAAALEDPSALVRTALAGWTPTPMEPTHILDTIDRVLALRRLPLFSDLDPADLERVALVATERRYEPGEVVFTCGEHGDDMLIIVDGEVEVRRPEGALIRNLGPGEHVGELALLRGATRSADVAAGAQGVHGLVLAGTELLAILEERPEVAMAMLATLAERLGTT